AACGEDFGTAFARYEAARIGRTTRVVDGSAANAKRFHNPRLADDHGAGDYIATEWSEAKVEQRYDWLFTYDALNVAIRPKGLSASKMMRRDPMPSTGAGK